MSDVIVVNFCCCFF